MTARDRKPERREVTERDLRRPEFRDADPADLEWREDGVLVRRDRWEQGIRQIAGALGMSRQKFEVADVVAAVKHLVETCQPKVMRIGRKG